MVHDVPSLPAFLAAAREFDLSRVLDRVRCPTFVAWEERDALAQTASQVFEQLSCPKHLERFAVAEGAGDHTAILARSLYLQRMFGWLDETVRGA